MMGRIKKKKKKNGHLAGLVSECTILDLGVMCSLPNV